MTEMRPQDYRELLREIGDGTDPQRRDRLDALAEEVERALDATPPDDAQIAEELRAVKREIDEARGLPHDADALRVALHRVHAIPDPQLRRAAVLRLSRHINGLLSDSESEVLADVDALATMYLAER
jgi:transposase